MNIQEIHASQIQFFHTNTTKSVSFRVENLKKLKQVLRANEDRLSEAIYQDFGKSAFETYATELAMVFHEINTLIRKTKSWSAKKYVASGLANFPAKSYIQPEPLGVALVIGAWNYPYQLSLLPALTALAAGNTVIVKPSELPSRTADLMEEIINHHFPSAYFCVINGGVEVTTELLKHRFDKIFFTGSIPVGRIIYEAAAKHLTPVTLELGGKSPTFVMADANIKVTARRIVWAKYLNAGQTCVAPDYVLVEKSIEEPFLEALKMEVQAQFDFEKGLPENYLRIINSKNFDRLAGLIDDSKLFHGGERDAEERVIRPTLLHRVTFADEIMQDEIFGPILPVISFDDLDEAIRQVKERSRPLSCYVYSKNSKTVDRIINEISFGGGCVNDSVMHLTNSRLPFGGVGFSGIGSYHGYAGFQTFSHYKSIVEKPFWIDPKIRYAPYTDFKMKLIRWFLG